MSEQSNKKTEKLSNKKYVRLAAAVGMWREEKTDFIITALNNNKGYCKTSDIPAEAYSAVNNAVEKGVLEFVNKPSAAIDKVSARTAPVTNSKGSFDYTENPDPKKAMKSPSFTGRTLAYKSDDPVEKQAFKLLADTPNNAIRSFTELFSTLADKDDRIKLIKAINKIEMGGHNPAMAPRSAVMEYISDVMLDLGLRAGLSSVNTEEEPLVKDVKPVRFTV